jgi:hypothetical protein
MPIMPPREVRDRVAEKHRTLSYQQVTHDIRSDSTVSFDEGLDLLALEGWDLVTSFPSQGYAPGCTTMFVFRRRAQLVT